MTFDWKIPPWQRNVDSTYMATVLGEEGGGQHSLNSTAVRGDNATEALADLLMGPGGAGGFVAELPNLIGVVIRSGIDIMWMSQPRIEVARGDKAGEYNIAVDADGAEVTAFSAEEARDLLARLRAQYGAK